MKPFLSLLLVWSQFFSTEILAKKAIPVLVPPIDLSEEEYQSALLAFKDHISVEEWEQQQSPSVQNIQELIKKFSAAESNFIESKDPLEAQENYVDLLKMETTEDWNLSEQKIFFISYLRLLQMNQDLLSPSRRSYLDHAAFYLSRMEAPRNLIPPPVVREVEERKSQFNWEPYPLPQEIWRNYNKMVVMGKPQATREPLLLPKEINFPLRIRFLSSKRPALIEVTSKNTLSELKVKGEPLVLGKCGEYALNEVHRHRFSVPIKIYEPLLCEERKGIDLAGSHQTSLDSKELALPGLTSNNEASWKMKPKHWIWLGVGSLAAAVLVSQLNKKNEVNTTTAPGESHGF